MKLGIYLQIRNMEQFEELLDDIENKVEEHRSQALAVLQAVTASKEDLAMVCSEADNQSSLTDTDREEIKARICRLQKRLDTVQVHVNLAASRDESQSEALSKINVKIDELIAKVEANSPTALATAESFFNACNSRNSSANSVICSRFEALLLGCTLDDQKIIKGRIITILESLKALSQDND